MTDRKPTNLAASVRQRLKNISDATSRPFSEVLQWYAIERFLARFSNTRHRDSYLLKGAALLRVWQELPARPTMDVDLGFQGVVSVEDAKLLVSDCVRAEVEPDGLEFDPRSIEAEPIRIAREYPGVRVRCRGLLGTARVVVQIDIGFGDSVVPQPELIEYPTLLNFQPARILAYRPETVIAEKLEAIVSLGLRTSRMKDYFDLSWLLKHNEFDGATMAEAVKATFSRRKTEIPEEVPEGLGQGVLESQDKQRQWRAFLRRMRIDLDLVPFEDAVETIRAFATPLFRTLSSGEVSSGTWQPKAGWHLTPRSRS